MIRSLEFDDIYFSAENGLAETRHVFFQGNNLPAAWQHKKLFTIAETGFGTGLNFLATWKLFEETAPAGHELDFVSFEKYPLLPEQIAEALSLWRDELGQHLERLVNEYPLRLPGFHRITFAPNVRLTLVFDDVNEALPQLVAPHGIDAWLLDGFAPAKNPQMWTDVLFKEMRRLSAPQATVATFTAAGSVRRGLADAGFTVEKVKGYGRKRDMTRGVFTQTSSFQASVNKPKRVAVIGGGLAGTATAYTLKSSGMDAVIFEKEPLLAAGASGNPLGIFNPRFSMNRTAESDFYTAGYALLDRTLRKLKNTGYQRCGSLHLATGEEKQARFKGVLENWGWHGDHCRMLTAQEASMVAGIALPVEALYLPDSGSVSPEALCRAYAASVDVRTGQDVLPMFDYGWHIGDERFDSVVMAAGASVCAMPALADLPLQSIRGQISFLQAHETLPPVKANICYSGYIAPAAEQGRYVAGSTFQHWRHDRDVSEDDHRHIIARLEQSIPALAGAFTVTGGRAALRCSAKDRFPVIGAAEQVGLYVNTAHGSHGLISSLAGAHLIADKMAGRLSCLSLSTGQALSAGRFKAREQKKKPIEQSNLRVYDV